MQPERQLAHESIQSSEYIGQMSVDSQFLPWISEPVELLGGALVTMRDEKCPPFIVRSAVGTNKRLEGAAQAMTEQQSANANNMFWSRIGPFVRDGYQPHVETMPHPATNTPIHVMRNNGGQRVYFMSSKEPDGTVVVTRLGVCDKNKQRQVLKVLSGTGDKENMRKMSEN